MKKSILRIVDANFNRSREGLRVCEEVARFVWNSSSLTRELRSVRNRVSTVIREAPGMAKLLCESRDTKHDVGRKSRKAGEVKRGGYTDIFSANIERVKESLRALEEFYKLVDEKNASVFTALRFKVYDIEKKARKLS